MPRACRYCGGRGERLDGGHCYSCDGTGKLPGVECGACVGTGVMQAGEPTAVPMPACPDAVRADGRYAVTDVVTGDGGGVEIAAVAKEGDARLMAAAPDLLAAVEKYLAWLCNRSPTWDVVKIVADMEEAVNKAKGRS